MNDLLISIVIPTRHRNDLLALCLDRLAPGKQTLPAEKYEVIVTDDGSTSTAQAMIEKTYPWVHWTAGPRKGPAANRNHGASLARGQWIAFTDDDCLPEPGWLAAFAAAIRDGVRVYEGKTVCKAGLTSPMQHAPINETGGWLWSCNMMVERALFAQVPFDVAFPHPHMEDVYYRERLRQESETFVFVPDATIDHPPRRFVSGFRWAMTHECEVIYHYKMHELPPLRGHYLWRLTKVRAKNILRYRLGADSAVAAYHAVVEIGRTFSRYNGWVKQYAGRMNAEPADQP